MSGFDASGMNQAANPYSSDLFERSVFRAAPSRFSIEFLPPSKGSSSYQHGLRICPILRGDRSSVGSGSSSGQCEYEIWRRWEDCLWLQDTLEKEYSRAAREKRTRLAQGKGVKMHNGMYKQDMASSWESLPPGPEPNSVARDVHAYLPTLTKKGTFFRPKPALVEKRQQEFRHLIETMMSEEMPALIKEIRANRLITDFFGFWRRDVEQEEKQRKKSRAPRSSITSSVFSAYFATSEPSLSSGQSSVGTTTLVSPSIKTTTTRSRGSSRHRSSVETAQSPKTPQTPSLPSSLFSPRARTDSSGSSSSEGLPLDSSYTAHSSDPRIAAEEQPSVRYPSNPARGDLSPEVSPLRESISEDSGMYFKAPAVLDGQRAIHLRRRTNSNGTARKANRNWSIYGSPVTSRHELEPESPVAQDDSTVSRESWQSDATADAYLDSLGLMLPTHREERDSMASINTFMTTDSTEAMIPRSPSPSTPSPRDSTFNHHSIRASIPISLSDFEMMGSDDLSLLDSFPRPLSYVPEVDVEEESRSDTPTPHDSVPARFTGRKDPRHLPALSIPSRSRNPLIEAVLPSPTNSDISTAYTTSSETPLSITSTSIVTPTLTSASSVCSHSSAFSPSSQSSSSNLSIKASYSGSVIALKVPRTISLSDIRQRLFSKFAGQEGVALPQEFSLIYDSKASRDTSESPLANMGDYEIESEYDWRDLADLFEAPKLILKIAKAASS
ncbi:hypothetical protein BKA70DRAFT_1277680 [Coprinopsis sp. MPI-PUGE-AT-0042]|nr:hypothetical protein BKA70DRAFT_1277680 [Coprinopsis sp. MPI-PUGE-AT-0042]